MESFVPTGTELGRRITSISWLLDVTKFTCCSEEDSTTNELEVQSPVHDPVLPTEVGWELEEGAGGADSSGRGVAFLSVVRDGAEVIDSWLGPMGERMSTSLKLERVDVKEIEGVIVRELEGDTDVLPL